MSNPVNTLNLSEAFASFLAAHSTLLQQKIDKPGGAIPAEGTIKNTGAVWGNFFDDFLIAYMADFNTGRVKRLAAGLTTDATPTNIGNLVAPIPDGSQVMLEVFGWGKQAANDFVFREFRVRAERDGGTVQTEFDVTGVAQYSAGGTLSTATYAVIVSGNDLVVQATGEVATNITWDIHTRCIGTALS